MTTSTDVYNAMEEEEFGYNDRFFFYQENGGDYRWRRVSLNGKVVGASTEGYSNPIDNVKNAMRNGMTINHKYTVEYLS